MLTFGINYSQISISDKDLSGPDKERRLQTVVPNFSLMTILDEQYSMVVTLRPGFYGDLKGDLGKDFRLEGGVVVTKFINESFTLGLGVGRGTNFGRDLVVPLVQFLYFASDKIVLRGLLPIRASVWYVPSQQWEFGAIYRLQGSLYNIEDDTNISKAQRLGFASAQLGAAARYNLFGKNYIVAEAGVTALRRYEWRDEVGTTVDIGKEPFLDRDLNNVPYLIIGWIEKF